MTGDGRRGPSRRPIVVSGLLPAAVVLLGALFYFSLAHLGLRLHDDEGYLLDLGARVLRGETPYRDFYTIYPPSIYYLLAGLFGLFGSTLLTARYLVAGARTASLLLSYLLCRTLVPKPIAALAPLLVLLVDILAGVTLIPYSAWPAEPLILIAWLFLARWLDREKAAYCIMAGACGSLAFAFKQTQGATAAMACLVWLWTTGRPAAGPAGSHPSGTLLDRTVFLLMAGLFVLPVLGGEAPSRFLFVAVPLAGLLVLWVTRRGPGRRSGVPWFLLGGLVATGVWVGAFLPAIGPANLFEGVILEPMRQGSARFEGIRQFTRHVLDERALLAAYLGTIVAGSFLILRTSRANDAQGGPLRTEIVKLGIVLASFLCFTLYPWPYGIRVAWIAVPFVVLAVWVGWTLLGRLYHRARGNRWAGLVAAGGCVGLLAFGLIFQGRIVRWTGQFTGAFTRVVAVHLAPETLEASPLTAGPVMYRRDDEGAKAILELVLWLEANTPEGEAIPIFPRGGLVYFLSGRRNPSYYGQYGVRFGGAEEALEAFIRDLEPAEVEWFILVEMEPEARTLQIEAIGKALARRGREASPAAAFGTYHVYRTGETL